VRYQRPLSACLLKKYEYQYRQHRQYESEDEEYENRTRKSSKRREDTRDHWYCPFFRYYWNSGMSQLPTINNCPECGPQKHDAKGVSVFQRLAPMPPQDKQAKLSHGENFEEEEEDKYHRPRWCPDGLSHSQKRMIQRLCTLEEAEAQYLEMQGKRAQTWQYRFTAPRKRSHVLERKSGAPSHQKPMGRHRQEQTWCSFSLQNSMH
jgi:hypothetical protein